MPTLRPSIPAQISVSKPRGVVRLGDSSVPLGRGLAVAIATRPIGGLRPDVKWNFNNGR